MRGRKINKIQGIKMFEHNRLIEYTKMVKESNTLSGVKNASTQTVLYGYAR